MPARPTRPDGADDRCLIVADSSRARFFSLEPADGARSRTKLVVRFTLANDDLKAARRGGAGRVKTERLSSRQAGGAHPIDARRQQHHLELERRFGRRIAVQVAKAAGTWKTGVVMLVAEPRLLGLMRKGVRDALDSGVTLKELAKDLGHLTPGELSDHPALRSAFRAEEYSAAHTHG
jgi:protein required for attachment to host cells